jgi:poly(A)-specific ribonuclease
VGKPNLIKNTEEEPQRISNFEKRLVHQLVRAEFTDLNSLGKPDFIQIVPLDEEREKQYRTQRKKKIKEQIDQQTGFRWVVEAMIGGDLSRLDPLSFAMNANGDAEFVDLRYIKDQFFRAAEGLRHKPRVLVGHNMFTDLMYFYRTFIGELPETVSEWQTTIHELFPLIIDTKYLATHECGDINPFSSLEEIEEKLRWQRIPEIRKSSMSRCIYQLFTICRNPQRSHQVREGHRLLP